MQLLLLLRETLLELQLKGQVETLDHHVCPFFINLIVTLPLMFTACFAFPQGIYFLEWLIPLQDLSFDWIQLNSSGIAIIVITVPFRFLFEYARFTL